MAILYVAALYNTVDAVHFYKNLATFFPCHLYIAKLLTMNTIYSTKTYLWCKWAPLHEIFYPAWLESQFASYRIYLNARLDFSLYLALKYVTCLKFTYPVSKWPRRTRLLWAGPQEAKPRPASPSSYHLTSVHSCITLYNMRQHTYKSVHRHTCANICNKNCTEAPVNMCICPEYEHAFISTYIAT